MKTLTKVLPLFVGIALVAPLLGACGGGIPVRIRIDEFTMPIDLDELVGRALGEFKSQGLLPGESVTLPELWPESLPTVTYRTLLASPPVPVDLTPPETDPNYDKYEMINQASDAIRRIEMNRLVLRIDASTLSIALPELRFQIADEPDADPNDRLAWETVGVIPTAAAGFTGDLEFAFVPGGESYLNSQFSDEKKELAIRIQGKIELDTAKDPHLPSGKAETRLIIAATFFVDPEGAAGVAGQLAGQTP